MTSNLIRLKLSFELNMLPPALLLSTIIELRHDNNNGWCLLAKTKLSIKTQHRYRHTNTCVCLSHRTTHMSHVSNKLFDIISECISRFPVCAFFFDDASLAAVIAAPISLSSPSPHICWTLWFAIYLVQSTMWCLRIRRKSTNFIFPPQRYTGKKIPFDVRLIRFRL